MNPVPLLLAIGLTVLVVSPARATLRVVPDTKAAEPRSAESKPAEPRPVAEPRPPAEARPAAAPRDVSAPATRPERPAAARDPAVAARPKAAASSECSDDLTSLSLGIDEPGKDRSKSPQCR